MDDFINAETPGDYAWFVAGIIPGVGETRRALKGLDELNDARKVLSKTDNVAQGGESAASRIFKDKDTGVDSISSVREENQDRIKELSFDGDKKKFALHEGEAAVQLETTLGGSLKRFEPIPGQKNPDFVFVDGPYAGKTVDFMWTESGKSAEINKFFINNLDDNKKTAY